MDLSELEKKFPGKKVTFKNGKIYLKDKPGRKGTGKRRVESINLEKVAQMEDIAVREGKIYIPYEVMSSKNSRVFEYTFSKQQGKKVPTLSHSEQYKEYVILTKTHWAKNKVRFLEMIEGLEPPYKVGFYFIRTTKQRFDYPNMMQGIMDLMVEHGWLKDDSMDYIKPLPIGYEVNKEVQGVILDVR